MEKNSPSFFTQIFRSMQTHSLHWACGIIAVSFLVRFWFVATGQLNLSQDEAQYWDWTRHLQLSYYSKGPLITWIISFWTSIFGNTELGVRFGAVVNGTLAQMLLYYGVAFIFKRPRLAVLSLLVAVTMPLALASGVLMTTDNPLLLCWMAAFFSLYALSENPHSGKAFAVLFLAMALGNLAKYMMLAFFAVALVYCIFLQRARLLPRGLVTRVAVAMGAGTALGFLPILLWNMQNAWVGFFHVGTLAGLPTLQGTPKPFIRFDLFPEFLSAQFGIAAPWWMVFILLAGFLYARVAWVTPGKRLALIKNDPLVHVQSEAVVRQTALLAAGFWPIFLAFFFWSFHTRIYPNWPGMAYVAGIILAAAGLERVWAKPPDLRHIWSALAPWWVILSLCMCLLVFASPMLPLPEKINPTVRLKGWENLGQEIAHLSQNFPDPKKVFYFADHYDITAELAFYIPGQPQAYCADFGRRMSQYDIWGPPQNKEGWSAIYVSSKSQVPPALASMFATVTPLVFHSSHQGNAGRTFTLVLLEGYTGTWPESSSKSY